MITQHLSDVATAKWSDWSVAHATGLCQAFGLYIPDSLWSGGEGHDHLGMRLELYQSYPQTPPFNIGMEGSLVHHAHILVPTKELGHRCWCALPYKRTMNIQRLLSWLYKSHQWWWCSSCICTIMPAAKFLSWNSTMCQTPLHPNIKRRSLRTRLGMRLELY